MTDTGEPPERDLSVGDLPDPVKPARTLSAPCTHCGPIASRWPFEGIDF